MSSDRPLALTARGLGKRYRLAQNVTQDGTLGETIMRRLKNPTANNSFTDFWATKDVSFDIYEGDVVGIIGRNGAGKSTLLKLLSRITEPTTGQIDLYGRVGSLLEVGTGFHPELTGRENVYLNGAILGMTHTEIRRQFDAIVEFAEVEKFLETPVKRYSSGMYVRLAFAVAAHLNPEILIVDEVLAVGDAAFQRKCLGKMQDVARNGGRTVLFVSHNMAAIRALCNRAILLRRGSVFIDSDTESAVTEYIREGESSISSIEFDRSNPRDPDFHFVRAWIENEAGEILPAQDCREPFTIAVEYDVSARLSNLRIGLSVQTPDSVEICGANDPDWSVRSSHQPGRYVTYCKFPANSLNEGRYLIEFRGTIPNERVLQYTGYLLALALDDVEVQGESIEKISGVLRPKLTWRVGEDAADVKASPALS